jgi:hypothetical protein
VWTGVAETTLFRAAMVQFLGDDLQSERRNSTFLEKHFFWEPNETKQSFHMLRAGVLTEEIKQILVHFLEQQMISQVAANKLIRSTYDFVTGIVPSHDLQDLIGELLPTNRAQAYLDMCHSAIAKIKPV